MKNASFLWGLLRTPWEVSIIFSWCFRSLKKGFITNLPHWLNFSHSIYVESVCLSFPCSDLLSSCSSSADFDVSFSFNRLWNSDSRLQGVRVFISLDIPLMLTFLFVLRSYVVISSIQLRLYRLVTKFIMRVSDHWLIFLSLIELIIVHKHSFAHWKVLCLLPHRTCCVESSLHIWLVSIQNPFVVGFTLLRSVNFWNLVNFLLLLRGGLNSTKIISKMKWAYLANGQFEWRAWSSGYAPEWLGIN